MEKHAFQVDPYIGCEHLCQYCYVLNQAETDWSKEILYYKDIREQLNNELEGIAPQSIYMGWRTDPYQPCEGEYKQTRTVLELLHSKGFTVSILTKSNLVLRDLDLLKAMQGAAVSFSMAFEDDAVRKLFEANTMPTEARIQALRECRKAGLRTAAMICPVIPHVTNPIPILERIAPFVDRVWVYGLSILHDSKINWKRMEALLQRYYPEEQGRVQDAVFNKDHPYWAELRSEVLESFSGQEFELSVHF